MTLVDVFTSLADKIRSKLGTTDKYSPISAIEAIDDVYDKGLADGTTPTQTKTVTAGTSAVTVNPDSGYALSSVTVNPTPSQTKSATPSTSAQTISPDSGKLLSSVTVNAVSLTGNASDAYVLNGYTYYNTSLSKRTGTMQNCSQGVGKTTTLTAQDTRPVFNQSTQYWALTNPDGVERICIAVPTTGYYYQNNTIVGVPRANIPNKNTGTYTFPSNSTGGTVDLADNNTYRYVNAANVYAKGKADVSFEFINRYSTRFNQVLSLGNLSAYKKVLMILATNNGDSAMPPAGVLASGATISKLGNNYTDENNRNFMSFYALTSLTTSVNISYNQTNPFSGVAYLIGYK